MQAVTTGTLTPILEVRTAMEGHIAAAMTYSTHQTVLMVQRTEANGAFLSALQRKATE